jgi:hypothetical protein
MTAAVIMAVAGAGAVLVWLLWRGTDRGSARGGETAPNLPRVRIRGGDRVDFDGVEVDLPTAVARARAAGKVRVLATGDARVGWIAAVKGALNAAGVELLTDHVVP